MTKTCAAQSIGQDAFLLVTVIAATEDAARYRRAVTFTTGQLLPILGFGKWERLDAARKKAVGGGWLHYEPSPSGSHQPGAYWAQIPEGLADLSDAPIDDGVDPLKTAYLAGYADGKAGRLPTPYGPETSTPDTPQRDTVKEGPSPVAGYGAGDAPGDGAGDAQGEPPILTLSPNPNTCASPPGEGVPLKERKGKKTYSQEFAKWYALYPRKIGKGEAARVLPKAIRKVSAERGISEDEALAFLCEAAAQFAKTRKGQSGQYCWHPATWLNDEHYDDDPAEWNRGDQPQKSEATPSPTNPAVRPMKAVERRNGSRFKELTQ
jgi:hypothetical protein